ncbi:UDP-N-acetylmuramoyl-tripeptide--D-alanyl-D-alanine ligase [bacterium]|nr:UDP-N-acetylmuramoyl-tripeptide--D-alanyl-D-alanine ligase [bacterium]
MRIPLAEVAGVVNASVIGVVESGLVAHGVSYDSRQVAPGNLFVAIIAQRDGHHFVLDAVQAGAAAVLVSREVLGCTVPQIVVADTAVALTALGKWAREHVRSTVEKRVIGITGSVGKTSTKDFIASVLATQFVVGASEKSLNNDQGVPVTLLNAPELTQALVVEMGMRGFGEIARLAALVQPHIGVITAVGESHSERVGGVEGVAQAKAELVESLPADGFAVLNADDARVVAMHNKTRAEVFTYGTAADADMCISDLAMNGDGCASFHLASQWGSGSCTLAVPGRHMASNAAAAVLVGALCGVPVSEGLEAIASTSMSPMRMQVYSLANGVLLDDSYNASPTSMSAALLTLSSMTADHCIAVLGVMAEISDAEMQHKNIVQLAQDLGIEVIAFRTELYGLPSYETYAEVYELLQKRSANTAILLKGSRVAGLEAVTQLLLGP